MVEALTRARGVDPAEQRHLAKVTRIHWNAWQMNNTPGRTGRLVMVDLEGTSLDAAIAASIRERQIHTVGPFRKHLGIDQEGGPWPTQPWD